MVSIDWGRVREPRLALDAPPPGPILTSVSITEQTAIAAEKPRSLFVGDGTARMEEMVSRMEAERSDIRQRQLSRERQRVLAEFQARRDDIVAAWQADRADAYVALLYSFQDEVELAGDHMAPSRYGIAWRVGWPDPDPLGRRRVVQPGLIPVNESPWLAVARADIEHEEGRLNLKWREQQHEVTRQYDAILQGELFGLAREELAEISAAEERVNQLFADRAEDLEGELSVLRKVVAGEPGALITISQTATASVVPPATAAPLLPATDRVLAERFASARGYDLRNGHPRARDVTDEYILWRQRLLTLSRILPNSPAQN